MSQPSIVVVGADHPKTPAAMLTVKTDLFSSIISLPRPSPARMKRIFSPTEILSSLYVTQHAPQRKGKNVALLSYFH
jgi:hypothetical protein